MNINTKGIGKIETTPYLKKKKKEARKKAHENRLKTEAAYKHLFNPELPTELPTINLYDYQSISSIALSDNPNTCNLALISQEL